MALYTTKEAIANRLSTRIQVGGIAATFGKTVVDSNLIDQVIPQVEGRVNGALRQRYCMPLKLTSTDAMMAIASIVEKFVCAEILPVEYLENGAEGGLRKILAKEAREELEAVLNGGVILPGECLTSTPEAGSNWLKVGQRGGTEDKAAIAAEQIRRYGPSGAVVRPEQIRW